MVPVSPRGASKVAMPSAVMPLPMIAVLWLPSVSVPTGGSSKSRRDQAWPCLSSIGLARRLCVSDCAPAVSPFKGRQ